MNNLYLNTFFWCCHWGTIATFTPKKYDTLLTYKASITWQNIHMGYIYKVNTYGYKVDMLSEDMQCITDSDIFISNCLNRHVLHVSMYEFLENVGPFDDNEPLNECIIIFQHFIQYVHFSVKCAQLNLYKNKFMSLHDKVLCCKFCMLINIICIKIQIIHCKYTCL
jgi:hypothetical protein